MYIYCTFTRRRRSNRRHQAQWRSYRDHQIHLGWGGPSRGHEVHPWWEVKTLSFMGTWSSLSQPGVLVPTYEYCRFLQVSAGVSFGAHLWILSSLAGVCRREFWMPTYEYFPFLQVSACMSIECPHMNIVDSCRCLQADEWRILSAADDKTIKGSCLLPWAGLLILVCSWPLF